MENLHKPIQTLSFYVAFFGKFNPFHMN